MWESERELAPPPAPERRQMFAGRAAQIGHPPAPAKQTKRLLPTGPQPIGRYETCRSFLSCWLAADDIRRNVHAPIAGRLARRRKACSPAPASNCCIAM